MVGVPQYSIRMYGDPVLRQRAPEVDTVDGQLKQLADDMVLTMYEAPGVGLAAPQVGVQKRMFVFDANDGLGPRAIVNPVLTEVRGEWTYDEGCLSVPGLSWPIVRPKEVHLTGYDLDGNEISIDADEFAARLFQHEVDHLDGVLLVEHLDEEQRKEAKRILRGRALGLPDADPDARRRSSAAEGPAGHPGL
jgi:peptide deformylase